MMESRLFAAALAAAFFCTPAAAQLRPMSEDDMSRARGQGLLAVGNSRLGEFDFTRIALDADVELNAGLRNIRLGDYRFPAREGTGADIDMPMLQFGQNGGKVSITNPYFEVVYRDTGDAAAAREVVGMRMGFDTISGEVGLKVSSLSGSLLVSGVDANDKPATIDSHTDAGGGKRWDGASALVGVRAGDASGPSRDFWISVLKTGVQFQAPSGTSQLPDVAQSGVWLNWRDKLVSLGALPTAPVAPTAPASVPPAPLAAEPAVPSAHAASTLTVPPTPAAPASAVPLSPAGLGVPPTVAVQLPSAMAAALPSAQFAAPPAMPALPSVR